MSKKFTMLLTLLLLLGLGTTNAQVTKYYKPGERKTTLTAGDKVMFYNTAINGDQDRTGFLIDNGSNFGHSKQKPSASPIFSEKVGVWTIEVAEDNTTYYKVNVKGTNGYVGIGGATNNAQAKDLFFHKWTESNKGAGVNSENVDGQKVLNADIAEEDKVWVVAEKAGDGGTTWNGEVNGFTTWSTGHPYAIYSVVEATTAELETLLANAKTTAKNSLQDLAKLSFSTAQSAITEIDKVAMENNDLEIALDEIDALVLGAKKSLDGKCVKLQNHGSGDRNGKYLGFDNANNRSAVVASNGDDVIWTIKLQADNTSFKLYNFVNNLYLGAPGSAATHTAEADAPTFKLAATTKQGYESTFALVCSNNEMVHVANHTNYKLIAYTDLNDGASLWTITSAGDIVVTREQYDLAAAAKISLPYAVQQAYGLVTDAANYYSNYKSDAEGSYAALLDNAEGTYFHSAYNSEPGDGSGVHYIQADLGEGNSIDEFYFYMKPRSGNGNNRPKNITVYGSNDINGEFTKIADVTTTLDASMNPYISAKLGTDGTNYRYIRLTVTSTNTSTKFFTLSELYFFPANSDVTALVDSYNTFSQASITSNKFSAAASALLNAETVLALSNIKKDAYTLLNANESNHAANPNLGQYTTEAYNALRTACEANDATEESIREAIAAFKASKNLPVFTISNGDVKDYAVGKSIYDKNSGTLYFKATNVFDKTMWWALDQTTTTVGVTENVGIYNVGTGNGFWGASSIKVAETSDAVEDDGLFLFYTTGNNTPIHFQNDNQQIVRWGSYEATSGSAAMFTYIGNTYELSQLSDELFSEAASLAAVNVPNFTFGTKMNEYAVSSQGALDEAVANRTAVLNSLSFTVEQITAAKTQLETAIAAVQLNMPVAGHYYRLRCTGEGMKRLQSTIVEGGDRLEMKSGDEGINNGSIFRYTKGGLKSCIENKFIDAYHFVADGANVPQVTFSAAANGAVGCYNIKIGDRYIFGADDNIDSGTGTLDNRAGYNWWLEEVETQAITYTYKVGETELATQEEKGVVGLPYPAVDVVLPLGYVATALEGNVVEGETAKDVACELNAGAIPFKYYLSYNEVKQWYRLNFAKKQYSLHYVADNAVLVDEETTPNLENWESYAWAFIGDPLTGFQVVNKKAGATKGLKAMKSDALTGGVVGEGPHTFKLTPSASIADVAGFYMAATNGGTEDRFNSQGGKMVYWSNADAGSTFAVSDINFAPFLPEVKTAAVATLTNYASVPVIYSTSTAEATEAVNAVELTSNDLEGFNAAVEEIDGLVVDYRKAAYEALAGKYFTIKTPARGNGYMQMSTSKVVGTAQAESPANLWQFVCDDKGTVNIYNPYTKKYLCEPDNSNSVDVGVTGDAANAGAYILDINANAKVADAKVKLTSNGKSVHMDGSSNLVRWDNGDASEWKVTEVTDFSEVITLYKAVAISSMDEWKNLSVVFDASLIEEAETAIQGINTTDWATFAAIDAELTKVTDAVAAKMFSFKNTDTANSNRTDAYLAANGSTSQGCGTKTFDYNAIWKLKSAGGIGFYLYNELNEKYLKNPSSGDLTADVNEAAVYTFEIVDNETGAVELHYGNETLHLAGGLNLMSYDNNDPASRWILAAVDVTADITMLLSTLTSKDYDEVPKLGQYTKVAYDALKLAETTAKTVAEVEHAIAEFKASKNLPVFTISNGEVKDYAKGKSIYDDNDGTLNFKTTDIYDKTMWWALDMTKTAVVVTEEVGIYNVGTGNGFWGASTIKITETNENDGAGIADDNLFLFYTKGNNTPIHFQNDNQQIVRWGSYEATSGSAAMFTYIGNTYDLNKLTDEQIAALKGLENTVNAKAYLVEAVVGTGAGQYQGDYAAFSEKFYAVDQLLTNSTLTGKATLTVEDINQYKADIETLAAALVLNTPVNETYFRIKGANSEVTPAGWYITGRTNADGGRIALTDEADASTIYYYKDGKLQAYQSGKYIGLTKDHYTFATSKDDETHPASEITFAASPRVAGAYTIMSADCHLHYKSISETEVEIDRCSSDEALRHDWYLEEVEKQTVTYIYKDGETELARQEVTEFAGMPYPAADATLPLGYTATALEGNIAVGETEKVITCTLNAEAIPFNYYDSYANVEQWYYLNFAKDQHFLFYAEDNTVLDVNKTAIDRTNREAYAWAFIGTPATGFQVVNKLASADKGLKAMKSDALTGGVVGEGAHTFKLTASVHFTKGFYMAATNGESTERFNSQDGKMVYWSGADAGSTFTVAVCPFGAVAELKALIAEAEELKTFVDANTGDQIGEFSEETASALATAITTAQAKGNAATAEDVAVLQAVLDATKIILPTAGQYYQIHSSYFATTMAVYSNGSNAMWKALNSDDKSFYWKAVSTEDGGIALMNAFDEKYIQAGWSVADDAENIAVKILAKPDAEDAAYEKGYRYGIFMNDGQMHANGHGNGAGTSGNLINYGGGADGASSWYIVPVELPTFCTVTYNFNYEGETKYTQSAELVAGAAYPAVQVPALPYGVTTDAATPEGSITESKTFEFTLTVTEEFSLPFEAVAEGQPTKWYYAQMHAHVGYVFYISTNGDNLVWHGAIEDAAKYIADGADHEDYLWGFVGNIWDGFKMVNKAGKAVISTGNGAVTVGDLASATAFKAWKSQAGGEWFCMKHSTTNNYLNLNSGKSIIDHWNKNDNGSSILVTEPGKEESLEVASIGYSTYYSDRSLVIPESVKAYVVTSVENREVVLEQVTGIIPAHTGLILSGAGKHTFVASTDASTSDVSGNLLKGTTTKQLITPAEGYTCYVLANPAGGNGVGLYIASLNKDESGNEGNTHFYNNANKVYLPVENPVVEEESGQSARALRFRFGGEGTTEIEPSTLNSQPSTIIYDLTGRRINEIVEKGIYIVNGKKVVIR